MSKLQSRQSKIQSKWNIICLYETILKQHFKFICNLHTYISWILCVHLFRRTLGAFLFFPYIISINCLFLFFFSCQYLGSREHQEARISHFLFLQILGPFSFFLYNTKGLIFTGAMWLSRWWYSINLWHNKTSYHNNQNIKSISKAFQYWLLIAIDWFSFWGKQTISRGA